MVPTAAATAAAGASPSSTTAPSASIVEESDAKGGTLKFGKAGEWGDNTIDPGNTYYGYSWDMLRNFGRSLTMFKTEPGDAGLEVDPRPGDRPRQVLATAARPGPTPCRRV